MKTFKAFIKPFEAPKRSLNIKFKLIFSVHAESGREVLKELISEVNPKPYQTPKMELSTKMVTALSH